MQSRATICLVDEVIVQLRLFSLDQLYVYDCLEMITYKYIIAAQGNVEKDY